MAVTYAQVLALIPNSTADSAVVTAIITDATDFLTSIFTDCDFTPEQLDAIIKWYAAHMVISGPERQAKREKLGEAEVEYDSQNGSELSSTSFGRMAILLDRCGRLKNVGKSPIVIKAVTSFK